MSEKRKKSAANSGAFRPGPDPRRGKGPRPGSGGRPLDDFKAKMRELVSNDQVEAYFERCLAGEFGPKFYLAARMQAKDDGYGKAVQAIEVAGAGGAPFRTEVVFVDPPKE